MIHSITFFDFVYYMECFIDFFRLCQLNVHNIVKEPGRVNLPGIFKLSAFLRELLILVTHTFTNKNSSKFLRFTVYIFTLIYDRNLLLVTFQIENNCV